jgi:uncharacterized repeat protein (TIGR01451 family)
MKKKYYVLFITIISIFLNNYRTYSQILKPFQARFSAAIHGDLRVTGNNIVGRNATTAYNGTNSNNDVEMVFVDIDGDASTFSSSSANISTQSCSKVVFAGLYWAAAYPHTSQNQDGSNIVARPANAPINQIKFKIPGGSYLDITADEIVYDDFAVAPVGAVRNDPYLCYKDVTNLLSPLADPSGTYTVANVLAATGQIRYNNTSTGCSGGWALVVVYENFVLNFNEPYRDITVFDGMSYIQGSPVPTPTTFGYSGFNTIASGPVAAKFAIGALEGDQGITGDGLSIRAGSNPTFTPLSNATNPTTNFFNSNITSNGTTLSPRNPESTNTTGFDLDYFTINNPSNTIIGNNVTSVEFQATTNGDTYEVFLNTFSIEVYTPELVTIKKAENDMGVEISNTALLPDQEFFYHLNVRNLGNDNATNAYILDPLPFNVVYVPGFDVLPAGVTSSFDAATNTIRFDLDPSIIKVNDPSFDIKFKVKVTNDCLILRSECGKNISNQAFGYYQGIINPSPVVANPSIINIDPCGYRIRGVIPNTIISNCEAPLAIEIENDCPNFSVIPVASITGIAGYKVYSTNTLPALPANEITTNITTTGTYYAILPFANSECADIIPIDATIVTCQLPIDLISFKANKIAENAVNITWKTTNENDFSHFELLYSTNAKEFGTLAIINGGDGNIYNYQHLQPADGPNYYRLKMVDNDGSSKLSKIIRINFEKETEYLVVENPAKNGEFKVASNLKNPVFTLFTPIGQQMPIQVLNIDQNNFKIVLKNTTPSLFLLNIVSEGKARIVKVFVP